jgi:pantoate--beta-alanine ligase
MKPRGENEMATQYSFCRLAQDLNIPSHIVGVPTVREADGLALSSRNMYLTAEQRSIAPALYNELKSLAQNLAMPANAGIQLLIDNAKANILAAGFAAVDYLELRDAQLLEPLVNSPASRSQKIVSTPNWRPIS